MGEGAPAPGPRIIDLSGVVAAVPGGRAGRQLLDHLVLLSESASAALVPPRIVTVGRLIDELCPPRARSAGRLARWSAWAAALKGAPAEERGAILRHPPEAANAVAWLRIGAMLDEVHAELAGHGLRFADVSGSEHAAGDAVRWRAMSGVQREYLAALGRAGLADGRALAIDAVDQGAIRADARIVLIGVCEMPGLAARALRRLGTGITALVVAPKERADWFDDLGCILAERWEGARPAHGPDRIRFVDGPSEQADAVLEALAGLGDRFATDEVVIGVADPEVRPLIEAGAPAAGGLKVRDAAGAPAQTSAPFRMLAAARTFLATRSFKDWGTFLRHPAVEGWIAREVDPRGPPVESWLAMLDNYAAEHLPRRVPHAWLSSGQRARLERLWSASAALLGELWSEQDPGARRALSSWAEPALALLRAAYGGRVQNVSDPAMAAVVEACELLGEAASEMASTAAGAGPEESVSAPEALGILLMLAQGAIAPAPDPGAVEMLGWLELPFDDAPAVIVSGMNEGRVPRSRRADPFCNDGLRRALGLPDARGTLARDLYFLSVLVWSRPELVLIAGRRGADGDPLLPSRLLFACDDAELLARVGLFLPGPGARVRGRPAGVPGAAGEFRIAPRVDHTGVKGLGVTHLREYLASPYGFFLRRVLGLEETTDLVEELDGGQFGVMVHRALRDFGRSPVAGSTSAEEIRGALHDALARYIREVFGARPSLAVQLQHAQALERLAEFAEKQAEVRSEGWVVCATEWPEDGGAKIVLAGTTTPLHGRIDRIDRNQRDGRFRIVDYKTAEKPEEPERAHRDGGGRWTDLQMPLYRLLAEPVVGKATPAFAYFVIPSQPGAVRLVEANWTPEDLRSADQAAAEVVGRIERAEFFDLGEDPPDRGVLGAICGRDLVSDAEQADPGEDEDEEADR